MKALCDPSVSSLCAALRSRNSPVLSTNSKSEDVLTPSDDRWLCSSSSSNAAISKFASTRSIFQSLVGLAGSTHTTFQVLLQVPVSDMLKTWYVETPACNRALTAHTASPAAHQQATDTAMDSGNIQHSHVLEKRVDRPLLCLGYFGELASQLQAEQRTGRPLTLHWTFWELAAHT